MQTKTLLSILAVVVVVLAGGAYMFTSKSDAPTAVTPTPQAPAPTPAPVAETPAPVAPTTPEVSTSAGTYKDGTYTAKGDYTEPSGTASLNVSLTINNGVVTDSTVTGIADNPDSRRYQKIFLGSYKTYVTGKKIDEVNITNMSGSSLTPAGFNAAVTAIKAQAKA